MIPALFLGFGALLVLSSLLVVLHRNPVTSALFLVVAFCSLAGLYLLLQAEFLGIVQIIVYAGAIMVLFLFVIMYLNLGRDAETGVALALRQALGWLVGAALVAAGVAVFGSRWAIGPADVAGAPPVTGNTEQVGLLLYSKYLFPFEITSIVLLVAMVGAIVITRGRPSVDARGEGAAIPTAAPGEQGREPAPEGVGAAAARVAAPQEGP